MAAVMAARGATMRGCRERRVVRTRGKSIRGIGWGERSCVRARAAAASGGAAEDPYKVLGVSRSATDEELKSAVRRKLSLSKGDEDAQARINVAYDQVLLSALTSRMSGNVNSGVKYADMGFNVPWRPRREVVDDKDMKINAAVGAVLMAATLAKTMASLTPSVAATLFFMFRIFKKLEPFYMVENEYEDDAPAKNARLARTMGVTFGFLAVGLFGTGLLISGVLCIGNILDIFVPAIFYRKQVTMLNFAAILSTGIAATYFR